jgi:hypothetical protein
MKEIQPTSHLKEQETPLNPLRELNNIVVIATIVAALAVAGVPTIIWAADAPKPDAADALSTVESDGDNADRPVVYRPLRTAPTFRHPEGYGAAKPRSHVAIPDTKPLPPEYGYVSRTNFDDITPLDTLDAIGRRLFSVAHDEPDGALESLRQLELRGDMALVPPLIHAMQFSLLGEARIANTLRKITAANPGQTWFSWAQWLESQPDLILTPGLAQAVVAMWSAIDGKYRSILPPVKSTQVPKASVYWDGSRVDVTTPVTRPSAVGPHQAFSIEPNDLVLGVSLAGQYRAYPVSQLLANPIVNDILGNRSLTVAYEPLCGLPIAIDRGETAQPTLSPLGWAGLVYRSSRLLYTLDGEQQLWDPCTSLSITGSANNKRERLSLANGTVTTWSAWRAAYPETSVMDVAQAPAAAAESLEEYDRYIGAESLIFPAYINSTALPAKEPMLMVDLGNHDQAIRLGDLETRSVINHRFGKQGVVIVVENPNNSTIRVYQRPEGEIFAPSEFVDRVYGSGGGLWKVTEDALISPSGEELARMPARGLFWFTVDGLNPITESKVDQSASLPY